MSTSKWKPYPEYFDTNIKSIPRCPSQWKIKKLKHVSKIVTGNTPSMKDSSNYEGGRHLWVKPNEIKGFEPTNDTGEKLTDVGRELSRVLPPFSIFVNGIGNIGEFGFSEKSVSTNQQLNSIIFNEHVDNRYGIYLVSALKEEFLLNSEKVVVAILNKSKQENISFILPPIDEQKLISSFLDLKISRIDSMIKNLEIEMYALEENRSSLITQAVTQGINPNVVMKDTGLDWYPEVPSDWKLRRVKHIATISPSNVDKKKYDGQEEVRLANYVDVYYNDRITEKLDLMVATASENEIAKFSLKAGDLIITKDSETWDDIAVPAFVPETMEGVVCGYHLTLIRPNQENVLGEFLFRTYQALGVRDQYYYNANGVTRYGLGSYWVDNGVVPVPPIDEQREIADYIDKQLRIIEDMKLNVESEMEKLGEYRTALISAAVTGKIDVRGL